MAKARKVTITLADATAGTGHRFGVCSLASTSAAAWGGGSQLLSAGRDGTICAWKYSEDAPVAPERAVAVAVAFRSRSRGRGRSRSPNRSPSPRALTLTLYA